MSNNTTVNLMPNLADGWAGMPSEVQHWIFWILGTAFVVFVVVAILFTFGGAIRAVISGGRGDIAGRSGGLSDAFKGIFVLLIAGISIIMILYIANSL